MIRFLLGLSALMAGLFLSIYAIFHAAYWSALANLMCGVVAAPPLAFGFLRMWEHPGWKVGAGAAALVSCIAILAEHRGFQTERQVAHTELATNFLSEVSGCLTRAGQTTLAETGFKTCGMQSGTDQLDGVMALAKAKNLGPGMSLIDGAHEAAHSTQDDCFAIYRQAERYCPAEFANFKRKYEEKFPEEL